MNDWNVLNVSGATGVAWNCLVRHTDAFLEDLLASYDWIVVLEELFVFCM